MFLFYDNAQTDKNASYYKGILFEKLLAEMLKKNGYTVIIRQKHNSLEYDLEGIDKTTNHKIIGEAKAYQESISGQILSAFLGKLVSQGIFEKKVHGLFLSTSPLTPEAKDFYNSVKQYGITAYCGEELFSMIIEALSLPTRDQVFSKVKSINYHPLFDYILITNYGYYKLAVASENDSMTPSYFIIFNNNLDIVSDKNVLEEYQQNIKELRALSTIYKQVEEKTKKEYRVIQQGLMISKDWTDYRLPAAPQFFVGRKELVSQITKYISPNQNESRVIQIKSRSGVGKSSMLALLSQDLLDIGYKVELHDARDIKSTIDVFSVIGRFTEATILPQNFSDVEEQLKLLEKQEKICVFMVDQFESTFLQPDIFTAYETIAKILCNINGNIFFCLARKNDQLTTYDDSMISLNQLNSISKNYELRDFAKEEAKELIDRINDQSAKKITREVLAYILEFAQGFPWLIKRTMSHILKLTNSNLSQKQLIDTGLMLDDLFEEELEGLDELEKEYLSKICNKLPADFHQLQRNFDEDALLPKMLDKFTQARLLRLTGNTYDTYNDVFKEYLVYQKLPEFKHQHIYRQHPNAIIKFFGKIVSKSKFTIEQLSRTLNISEKTLANYIKECRNLGLLKKEDDYWVLPKNIRDIYTQGHLGAHIRRQLLNNDLVSNLVKTLAVRQISFEELINTLKVNFPYVEAAENTWTLYANVLIAWLEVTQIVERSKTSEIKLKSISLNEITELLGNLINATYGKRGRTSNRELFLPSTSWGSYEKCFYLLKNGQTVFDGENKKAYVDMKNCGLIERLSNILDTQKFKAIITEEYLNTEEYRNIWDAAKNGGSIIGAVANLIKGNMSASTLNWRAKRIINCGKALGIIENKRYTYKAPGG
ncbi:restriction endonuclease [Sporomusa sphaeroides]|uniref:restriction endonuclease n=1 Tax=Sporomusa sphaeroides TaxID=47679 RepID=UPI003DA17E30